MSFFNQLKTYPEYHDAVDALRRMGELEHYIIVGTEKAFGRDFTKYCDSEPKVIGETLKKVSEVKAKNVESIKLSQQVTEKYSYQFSEFYNMYNTLAALQYLKNETLKDATEKKHALQRKQQMMVRTMSRVLEKDVEKFTHTLEKAEKAASDAANEYEQKLENYRKEFREKISDQLHEIVANRKKLVEKNLEEADHILKFANNFAQYEDELVPKLKEELTQLQANEA